VVLRDEILEMEDRAQLGALSLLMKGETLPLVRVGPMVPRE